MKHIKQLLVVKDNFFSTGLPTYFTNLDRKEAAIEHRHHGHVISVQLRRGPQHFTEFHLTLCSMCIIS